MTYLRTMLVALAALSLGALLGGPAQAQLGNGGNAIGGGEAIAGGAGAADDAPAPRVGSESVSRISTQGQCDTNKTRFRTETDQVNTTSTAFVSMPNSNRVIPVGASGCIIVTFTGEFAAGTGNLMFVRAGVQGGPLATSPTMQIGLPAAFDWSARTMQFVFTNLPAGNHTVHLRFRSFDGSLVYAKNRVIKYEYR